MERKNDFKNVVSGFNGDRLLPPKGYGVAKNIPTKQPWFLPDC